MWYIVEWEIAGSARVDTFWTLQISERVHLHDKGNDLFHGKIPSNYSL